MSVLRRSVLQTRWDNVNGISLLAPDKRQIISTISLMFDIFYFREAKAQNHCILMDSSFWFDTLNKGYSIVYIYLGVSGYNLIF